MFLMGSVIGLFSPLVCLIFHVLIYRLWRRSHQIPRQKLTVLVALCAMIFSLLLTWSITHSEVESLHGAIVSLLFGYTYFHWFNMSETARRVRVLVRYVALGLTPQDSARDAYTHDTVLNNRIPRLLETGTIKLVDGKYEIQRGPLLFATRLILFWRSLFYVD